MKPELTPSEAVSIMQDVGSTLSLESFKRCLPLADESIKK